MSVVVESFTKGYCWDFTAVITNANFTAANLTGSQFKIYLGSSLLKTITAGGSGYTYDSTLTKVTLTIHVEQATTALLTSNAAYELFIEWLYGATLEHKKKITLNSKVEVK